MLTVSEVNTPMAMGIVEKLTGLYTVLKEGMHVYERIAFKLRDKQLQQTILGIAQECNQYAAEVFAQIYCMGGSSGYPSEQEPDEEAQVEKTVKENISEVFEWCEKKVLPFYRNLQKETMQIDELKQMIAYQMKGFLYYIEQLKLLRTSI